MHGWVAYMVYPLLFGAGATAVLGIAFSVRLPVRPRRPKRTRSIA